MPENRGDWFALAAGMLWGGTIAVIRKNQGAGAFANNAATFLFGTVFALALAFLLPAQRAAMPDLDALQAVALVALAFGVLGLWPAGIGMIWGMRYISPTGMFAASNPTEFNGYPVNKHIIFMTDGLTDTQTNPWYYSAYGVNAVESRMQGTGNSDELHVARFHSACALARSMNITVWIIALDVADTTDVEPCASSADHFYTSDGTDLEQVFTQIGQGIGDLRLVK